MTFCPPPCMCRFYVYLDAVTQLTGTVVVT